MYSLFKILFNIQITLITSSGRLIARVSNIFPSLDTHTVCPVSFPHLPSIGEVFFLTLNLVPMTFFAQESVETWPLCKFYMQDLQTSQKVLLDIMNPDVILLYNHIL